MPRVSVVMPVFNGEKFLAEAIDSIVAQSFKDWELILVNEYGSNNAATTILRNYEGKDARIRVIQNTEKLGIAESLNVGFHAACGEYIARMDGDDISGKDRLLEQVSYLDAHPDIGILGVKPRIFGADSFEWNTEYTSENIFADSLFFLPFLHPTVMIRKADLDKWDLSYDPDCRYSEDFEFFNRALQHIKGANLDIKKLFSYRSHSAQATYSDVYTGNKIYKKTMRRSLERLGFSASEEELSLLYIHEGTKSLIDDELLSAMSRLDLLMKGILLRNMKAGVYSTQALFHTMHKRWEHMWRSDIMPTYGWKVLQKIEDNYKRSIFYQDSFFCTYKVPDSYVPDVTVLMSVHNGEKYLYEAIKSIENQTYNNWELLIINDASQDGTLTIVEEYQKHDERIRLIHNQKSLSLASTLNRGIDEARGKYIARMDDDDISLPTRLEKEVKVLERYPDVAVVGSWQRHFGTTEWIHQPPETPEEMKATLLFNCDVCHTTVMFRKNIFQENKFYYDPRFYSEDYELWIRVSEKYGFYTIQEVLGEYRLNGENITAKKMEKLDREARGIVREQLKQHLGIRVSEEEDSLVAKWTNPFLYEEEGLKSKLLEQEKQLLTQIYEKNLKKKYYDAKALKKVIKERWRWATGEEPSCVSDMSKDAGRARGLFVSFKRLLKRIIKPLYAPFRRRYENRLISVQKTAWELDGISRETLRTIYDVDGHMYDYVRELESRLEKQDAEIHRINTALEQLMKTEANRTDGLKDMASQLVQSVRETAQLLSDTTEVRIGKAEQLINQTIDERIWKAEQLINQTTDGRIWKAEQLINQTTDGRIWKSEQLINQTTDGRIWKAEQALNQTIDGRIWEAERTITTIAARTEPRLKLHMISVHLVEHCNLNCQGCDNFSPLSDEQYTDLKELQKDFMRLKELTNGDIDIIDLLGGEPLLHPQICDFIAMSRHVFEHTNIRIITNGILLQTMPDTFWDACETYKIILVITKYPIRLDMKSIDQKARDHHVSWRYFSDDDIKTSFCISLDPKGMQDGRCSFRQCFHANECIAMRNGRIYTCCVAANIWHYNKYFGEKLPDGPENSISIYEAKSLREILEFISRPIPLCSYCDIEKRTYNMPWAISEKKKSEWVGLTGPDAKEMQEDIG